MSVIRRLDPDRDSPALHAIFGDEESCRYLPDPARKTEVQTLAQIRRWTDGCEDTSWAVIDEPAGPCLGRVAAYRPGEDAEVWEVACMILPAARGRGLARRALTQALDYTFEAKGARRIFADIDPDNIPSKRTFEKLGFRFEGRLRALWKTHIGVRDTLLYALLRDDPRHWRS